MNYECLRTFINNIIAVGKVNSIQFYSWDNSQFTYIDTYNDINMTEVDLELKNNYLYIADKIRGVIILDISDNSYPIVGEFEGRGTWTFLFGSEDIEIADDGKIYLSDFNAGVIIIEPFDTTLTESPIGYESGSSNIKIYPNPASSFITIELENNQNAVWDVSLINIKGQEILHKRITDSKFIINIKDFPTGVYFIQLSKDKAEKLIKKIIIK